MRMSSGRFPSDALTSADIEPMRSRSLGEGVDFGLSFVPNHGAAANGLSAVRSMDGYFLGRSVRPIGGGEAVADLIR